MLIAENILENHSVSQQNPDENEQQSPALVIYIVEPFTFSRCDADVYRLVTLGLLHSYADMLSSLPESTKNCINLQVLHAKINLKLIIFLL